MKLELDKRPTQVFLVVHLFLAVCINLYFWMNSAPGLRYRFPYANPNPGYSPQQVAVPTSVATAPPTRVAPPQVEQTPVRATTIYAEPVPQSAVETKQVQQASPPVKSLGIIKDSGDLRVELQSLRITDGKDYVLSFNLSNRNSNRNIAIALAADWGTMGWPLNSSLSDPDGFEFKTEKGDVTGLAVGSWDRYLGYRGNVTTIKPGDTISATIKYFTRPQRSARLGNCHLQLEFLMLGFDSRGEVSNYSQHNLVTDL